MFKKNQVSIIQKHASSIIIIMSLNIKHHLPLLSVLQRLHASDRQILIDHLDQNACDALSFCLTKVLQEGQIKKRKKKVDSQLVTKLVRDNHFNFQRILGLNTQKKKKKTTKKSSKSSNNTKKCLHKQKRLALAKIGGNPLAIILSTAIPLLLNMIK